ncbi:uncharacterized protein LOC142101142 isoform X2 [Mixophyes fleayi]|uniref:uncharacterized protein LOC142101142 isoform X2 n=1 Tax=Mixophyes fleayi TaxID=3061075 RepID=UPI003F4E2DAF
MRFLVVTEEMAIKPPAMDNILPQLLSPSPQEVQQCVAQVMGEVQTRCDELVEVLVKDTRCSQYLAALGSQLETPDVKLCSNIAYILGTVAEDPTVAVLLVELAENSTDWDLLGRLGAMLLWEDAEAVMNAAGALGTLAENVHGRRWLLSSPDSDFIIENITNLLGSPNDWTASNCALVLARISMCHDGCARLLDHPKSDKILRKIITSLHVDEAGCGLNAAFTLGRLCDTDIGRRRVLGLQEANNMIAALEAMMSGGDAGGSRNACFALTCLATSHAGHQHVLRSQYFPQVLDTLCRLLQSKEQETCWFAAITIKILSKYPAGVVRLRLHSVLETILRVAASHTAGEELLEEVETTLQNLQRLPQPEPPTGKILESGSIIVGWEEYKPKSGLPVTYCLFDGDKLLYQGPSFSYVISHCNPGQHHLKIVMTTEGDHSKDSSVTSVMVKEPFPDCPSEFQVLGRTTKKVKLSWSPPANSSTNIKYYVVYRDEMLVETTPDLSCIVGGLSPSTSYTFSVCSCNSRGHSQKVSLVTRTMDRGDHSPDKLTANVIGRSEMFITWEVPKDPVGRFFNYELSMNGRSVYLGTERSYTARRLIPNTEYTCTVCAITSEGRFESRPITKRTARDEYSNLNKNQIGNNRHAASSPTAETPDQSEKQPRTEAPRRSSLTKSQSVRLVMSRQTSKVLANRSRRESVISWSTESSEGAGAAQPSPTQPSSPCQVSTVQRENRIFPDQTETGHEKKTEILQRKNSMPSKQIPLKMLDNACAQTMQSQVTPDARKPQSALGFRLTPIASLCSLEADYLLNGRAKSESEIMRPPPQDGHSKPTLAQDCSRILDRDKSQREPLQPVKVRYRHNNLKINAWDLTGTLRSGDGKLCNFSGKCPLISNENVRSHLPPKNLVRKDNALSRVTGQLEGRHQSWTRLRSERSQLQGVKSTEGKDVEAVTGPRNKGPLYRSLHKDVQALIGDSRVTFRLLPPPNSIPQRVRPHH